MFNSILRNALRLVVPAKQVLVGQSCSLFHVLVQPKQYLLPQIIGVSQLLRPSIVSVEQNCGFKVKGRLRRRCKDCYFVMREKRLYVICKTHPRHKQMSMAKREENTWILTHATMGKVRPW